jgi:hypothetical protein
VDTDRQAGEQPQPNQQQPQQTPKGNGAAPADKAERTDKAAAPPEKIEKIELSTLKVALHKGKGTPLPDEWASDDDLELK